MRPARGFTLTELVVIIVILGILAVFALPRLTSTEYRALEFHDKAVAALRYAQKTATSHRRPVCVSFTASSLTLTIALTETGACSTALPLPGSAGNTVSSTDATNAVFTSGHTSGTLTFQPDGTGSDRSLVISGMDPIRVFGSTGYVQ